MKAIILLAVLATFQCAAQPDTLDAIQYDTLGIRVERNLLCAERGHCWTFKNTQDSDNNWTHYAQDVREVIDSPDETIVVTWKGYTTRHRMCLRCGLDLLEKQRRGYRSVRWRRPAAPAAPRRK